MRWATAAEVIERFPAITSDDLVGWAALGQLAWRSEPVYKGGRFVGAAIVYDLIEVEELLAVLAAAELIIV